MVETAEGKRGTVNNEKHQTNRSQIDKPDRHEVVRDDTGKRSPLADGRGQAVPWRLSNEGRISALKAYANSPEMPGRVFRCLAGELIAHVEHRNPFAVPSRVSEHVRQHCLLWADFMLTEPQVDWTSHRDVGPSQSLLVAMSAVAFVWAIRMPYESSPLELPGTANGGTALENLTMLSTNILGKPYGASEDLLEILAKVLHNDKSRRELKLSEDAAQETLQNAFLAIGGLTPELVEEIVKTGEVPYKAKHLVDPKLIARLYSQMEECFKCGLDVQGLADWLLEASSDDDLIEGLRGRWVHIYYRLLPFLWPPANSTAGMLPAMGPVEWIAHNLKFLRRIRGRDEKSERRKPSMTSLDTLSGMGEREVPLYEIIQGDPGLPLRIDDILEGLSLTEWERDVARLRSAGHTCVILLG